MKPESRRSKLVSKVRSNSYWRRRNRKQSMLNQKNKCSNKGSLNSRIWSISCKISQNTLETSSVTLKIKKKSQTSNTRTHAKNCEKLRIKWKKMLKRQSKDTRIWSVNSGMRRSNGKSNSMIPLTKKTNKSKTSKDSIGPSSRSYRTSELLKI